MCLRVWEQEKSDRERNGDVNQLQNLPTTEGSYWWDSGCIWSMQITDVLESKVLALAAAVALLTSQRGCHSTQRSGRNFSCE